MGHRGTACLWLTMTEAWEDWKAGGDSTARGWNHLQVSLLTLPVVNTSCPSAGIPAVAVHEDGARGFLVSLTVAGYWRELCKRARKNCLRLWPRLSGQMRHFCRSHKPPHFRRGDVCPRSIFH